MSRKNTMLGLAALAALGFAATSFAQCPSSPVPPWSGQNEVGGGALAITSGGFDGTSCKLDAQLTQNLGSGLAVVRDETPANEPRYRAQFLVNVDGLVGQTTNQPVRIFNATTDNPSASVPDVVRLTVFGNAAGTSKTLGISTACASAASGRCVTTAPLNNGTDGVHRIEIDWVNDASGYLRVWVNATDESNPTRELNVDNSAWGGVDAINLGLGQASPAYRSAQLNNTVSFDEFDSRRSTFIGN